MLKTRFSNSLAPKALLVTVVAGGVFLLGGVANADSPAAGSQDDGRRYELIDGELLVSPATGLRHQTVGLRLCRLLDDACPDELYVLAAPFAVQTDVSNEVQPDVLVTRFDELTDKNLPAAPVLAVEVLSPSGRLIDLNLKRAAYQRMGTPSYWVLDPDVPDCWSSNSTTTANTKKWPERLVMTSSRPAGRSRPESCRTSYSGVSGKAPPSADGGLT